ncbi:MAG: hypothetical protein K0U66_06865 [Gammaproteobacteria bacterium]|nr:hypothetical protein [Pseudomonadota bacterium]MCH9663361.1 hypothetical protein [Gammaproteobacteria bacterium]
MSRTACLTLLLLTCSLNAAAQTLAEADTPAADANTTKSADQGAEADPAVSSTTDADASGTKDAGDGDAVKPDAESASKYLCTYHDLVRRIEIVYATQAKVPCQVMYHKKPAPADEWISQSVWNSQNETGYCEARAEEFVSQHRDWGWDCKTQ